MEGDEDEEATAGPSSAAGATRSVQAGPLSAAQKTTMGLVLRDIFFKKDGGCHSVKLAQLVEEYNKKASTPASAQHIDQASTEYPLLEIVTDMYSQCLAKNRKFCSMLWTPDCCCGNNSNQDVTCIQSPCT